MSKIKDINSKWSKTNKFLNQPAQKFLNPKYLKIHKMKKNNLV